MSYLGRHIDPVGIAAWVGQLLAGGSIDAVNDGILASDEFFNRSGASDEAYVSSLYQTILGRDAETSGLEYWSGQLGALGRQGVAHGIGTSAEGRAATIISLYNTYLHRAPDAGGLAYWESLLAANKSRLDIITGIMTSQEFLSLTIGSAAQLASNH